MKKSTYKRNGKAVNVTTRKVGTVPIEYMQDYLALHHAHASGDIEGKKFTVCDSGEKVYVQFKDMKGSLPSIAIDVHKLVEAAYAAALKENLFK